MGYLELALKRQKINLADIETINVNELTSIGTRRIKLSPFERIGTYVGHSGGKDSVVVNHLALFAYGANSYPIVHTPKVSGSNKVHELTRKFLYELDEVVTYVPSSLHSTLGYKTQIDGTREAEASREDGRSTTFVKDGIDVPRTAMGPYFENGLFGLNFVYPIYDWSDLEVWAFIYHYKLPISGEYL